MRPSFVLVPVLYLICFTLASSFPAFAFFAELGAEASAPAKLTLRISGPSVSSLNIDAEEERGLTARGIQYRKSARLSDVQIEEKIREKILDDPFIKGRTVKISVKSGTAILEGVVTSWAAHAAATADAFQGGALRVRNHLKVKEDESLADEKSLDLESACQGSGPHLYNQSKR